MKSKSLCLVVMAVMLPVGCSTVDSRNNSVGTDPALIGALTKIGVPSDQILEYLMTQAAHPTIQVNLTFDSANKRHTITPKTDIDASLPLTAVDRVLNATMPRKGEEVVAP